jgi:hypothetical protein
MCFLRLLPALGLACAERSFCCFSLLVLLLGTLASGALLGCLHGFISLTLRLGFSERLLVGELLLFAHLD